jgi:AraC-like DNA-binding protein
MSKALKKLSDRPTNVEDPATDILADLLSSLRLRTLVYGRVELRAPWGLRFPDQPDAASLYVIARGGAQLEMERSGSRGPQTGLLAAGDVALLPEGGPHVLRDGEGSPVHVLGEGACRRSSPLAARSIRLGGTGAPTTLVAGSFQVGAARRTFLLQSLPPLIHISAADPQASPWLASTVQLLIAESAAQSPGGTVVVSRLLDVLLIQILRTFVSTPSGEHRLCALADPQVGRALQLIHARPAEPWTVEGLASAVGQSRSGFAARFAELVGEPPLEYVARWRMTKAADLLRLSDLPLREVAERVGYHSEAAFNRAFKRREGTAPATYRRQRA